MFSWVVLICTLLFHVNGSVLKDARLLKGEALTLDDPVPITTEGVEDDNCFNLAHEFMMEHDGTGEQVEICELYTRGIEGWWSCDELATQRYCARSCNTCSATCEDKLSSCPGLGYGRDAWNRMIHAGGCRETYGLCDYGKDNYAQVSFKNDF